MRTVVLELPDALADRIDQTAKRRGYSTSKDLILTQLQEIDWLEAGIESWLKTTVKDRLSKYQNNTAEAVELNSAFSLILHDNSGSNEQNPA